MRTYNGYVLCWIATLVWHVSHTSFSDTSLTWMEHPYDRKRHLHKSFSHICKSQHMLNFFSFPIFLCSRFPLFSRCLPPSRSSFTVDVSLPINTFMLWYFCSLLLMCSLRSRAIERKTKKRRKWRWSLTVSNCFIYLENMWTKFTII